MKMADPETEVTVISDQESSDDESSSSDDSESGDEGFLDMEAAESHGSLEDENSDIGDFPEAFYQFSRLPPELRRRVWEFFCPDLLRKSRLLTIDMSESSFEYKHARVGERLESGGSSPFGSVDGERMLTPKEGPTLPNMTRPLRTVLAVHGESRAIGLQAFPETLTLDSYENSVLSFNRDKDVIYLKAHRESSYKWDFLDFAAKVTQLAIDYDDSAVQTHELGRITNKFDNLRRVFISGFYDADYSKQATRWCGADQVYAYELRDSPHHLLDGIWEDTMLNRVYVWPDLDQHPDFAKFSVPSKHLKLIRRYDLDGVMASFNARGIQHHPMVSYEVDEYETIRRKYNPTLLELPVEDSSSDDDDDAGTESDDYESEGIDDAEIEELSGDSEDEDESAIHNPQFYEDLLQTDPGFQPQFSSIEPESGEDERAEIGGNNGEGGSTLPSRARKRRVVSDSDDDEDGPTERPAKRSRVARAVASDSDDNDDDDVQEVSRPSGATRNAPVAVSDSESESETAEDETNAGRSKRAAIQISSSESESDDDDDAAPAQMTLAERLQKFREENPVPDSEDGDSSSHKSYDSDGNSLMPESDDDDGEDDEDEEDSENGLLDEMAEDSDGEGEDGSDDE